MSVVLEHVERKMTCGWILQFMAIAVAVFGSTYAFVRSIDLDPQVPLMAGCLVFVAGIAMVSKRLPIQRLVVLRLREDGDIDLLLSKDPHQAVGSWWRHRITIDTKALDLIRFAQSQANTSLPDVRWWYWVRFESGTELLDTWIPDGLDARLPEEMNRMGELTGIPVFQEERIGIRRAHRYRKEQKKQTIPGCKWPS